MHLSTVNVPLFHHSQVFENKIITAWFKANGSICPLTGQPDFAKLRILYQPDQLCVESKSLKLYLWSFRDRGAFHEAVTNQILDDLVKATQPQWMRIEGDFLIRGGIRTLVVAEHGKQK